MVNKYLITWWTVFKPWGETSSPWSGFQRTSGIKSRVCVIFRSKYHKIAYCAGYMLTNERCLYCRQGFICPICMQAWNNQEELLQHWQSAHDQLAQVCYSTNTLFISVTTLFCILQLFWLKFTVNYKEVFTYLYFYSLLSYSNLEYFTLVYTTQVKSAFRAFWLVNSGD